MEGTEISVHILCAFFPTEICPDNPKAGKESFNETVGNCKMVVASALGKLRARKCCFLNNTVCMPV